MEPLDKKVTSKIDWKDDSNGIFVISENRGKAAIGFIEKSAGNLSITLIKNEYSPKYLERKVHKFVNTHFKERINLNIAELLPPELYQYDVLITTAGINNNLIVGEQYRFDEEVTNFLVDGMLDCNGSPMEPPILVRYGGRFWDRCAPGQRNQEFCKYIILPIQ